MKKIRLSAVASVFLALLILSACVSQHSAPYSRTYQSSQPDISQEYQLGHEPTEPYFNIAPAARFELTALAATPQLDLSISQNFHVTRPTRQNNYRITTELATYFITGTSNPNQPLLFNGNQVERLGTLGTWGVHVPLSMGENVFTASQGGETTTITITRQAAPGIVPINAIVQNSMFPATQGGVRAGGFIPVEATAPSGSSVTASFGGQSVALQQVASAAPGIPATFRGQLPVGQNHPAGVTTRVGPVSYQLNHGGTITSFQSTGDIFVAGQGSHIAVRVTNYLGLVNPNPTQPLVIHQILKTGATDFVYAETNTHFRLFSGGYLNKNSAEIIEGEVRIGNTVSGATSFMLERRETYLFAGINRTAFHTQLRDNVFYFTLFNTAGTPLPNVASSQLFSSVTATTNSGANSVTYAFTLRNPSLWWGYQVWYDGDNTVLRFQYRPNLSGGATPLSGVTVMLDPGHGGNDPGALGIAAGFGPDENTLNMAVSFALRDELVAMGATVLFTRTQLNQGPSLDERLRAFEVSDADFFISVHHNALLESTDANTVTGAEIFFHTPHSAGSARSVLDGVIEATGRNRRQVNQGAFRVTLHPRAPSMLLELGFMSHPIEYERMTNPEVIRQSARGIAQGIVQSLR